MKQKTHFIPKKEYNSKSQNIKTFVRIRPLNDFEVNQKAVSCLTHKNNSVFITTKNETRVLNSETAKAHQPLQEDSVQQFNFDKVLSQTSSQEEVFKEIGVKAINQILDGYNCSVLAYGVTGSGKTHTMTGYYPAKELSNEELASGMGLYPRLLFYLTKGFLDPQSPEIQELFGDRFSDIEDLKIYSSNVEIYNEKWRNLLPTDAGDLVNLKKLHYMEETAEIDESDKRFPTVY